MEEGQRLWKISPKEKVKIRDIVRAEVAKSPEVVFAYLFGSFVEDRPFHDVDVGIYVTDGVDVWEIAFDLAESIEKALQEIGYNIPVDVRVLNEAPVGFRYYVYRGELLFTRDEDLLSREVLYTGMRYLDMKPLLEQALKEAITSWH